MAAMPVAPPLSRMPCGAHRPAAARIGAALLAAAAAMPWPAQAAKLGAISVQSSFGEPLRAVVEVTGVEPRSRPSAAELASPQTYADLGLPFPAALREATARLLQTPDGRWTVRISGQRAVDERDFEVVLAVTTPAGRHLRRYRLASEGSAALAPVAPAADASAADAPRAAPPTTVPPASAESVTPVAAPGATSAAAAMPAAPGVPPAVPSVADSSQVPSSQAPSSRAASSQAASPAGAPPPTDPARPGADPGNVARVAGAPQPRPASDVGSRPGPLTARAGDTATSIARLVKPSDVSDEQAVMALYRANERAFRGSVHRLPEGAVLQVPDAAAMREVDPRSARAALRAQPFEPAGTRAAGPVRDRLLLAGGGTGRATSPHGGRGTGAAVDAIAHETAMSEANSRVRELESIVAGLRKLIDVREQQIAAARTELAALRGAGRPDAGSAAPERPAPIGAASATLVRVQAGDARPARSAVEAPQSESLLDRLLEPQVVAAVVAVLALVGALLWRRRRQASRPAVPDTLGL